MFIFAKTVSPKNRKFKSYLISANINRKPLYFSLKNAIFPVFLYCNKLTYIYFSVAAEAWLC